MIAYYEDNEPRGEYVLILGKEFTGTERRKTTGVESAYCAGTYGALS